MSTAIQQPINKYQAWGSGLSNVISFAALTDAELQKKVSNPAGGIKLQCSRQEALNWAEFLEESRLKNRIFKRYREKALNEVSQELNGVRYGYTKNCILIECPICGKLGALQNGGGSAMQVKHQGNNFSKCRIGFTHPDNETLKTIKAGYKKGA